MALAGTIVLSVLILYIGLDRGAQQRPGAWTDRLDPTTLAAMMALGFANALLWYPLLVGHVWGQVQVFLNLLVALSLFHFVTGRMALSGFWLGLCCLFKPHYAIVLLWAVARRAWSFSAALLAVGIAGLLAGLLRYGLQDHLTYIKVLSFLSAHGEAIWVNQSLNGLLHRFIENGVAVEAPGVEQSTFPPYVRSIHIASLLFTLSVLIAAIWPWRKLQGPPRPLDLATVLVAVTLASPIAWMHQYGAFLPVLALLAAHLARKQNPDGAAVALLALSFLAMGQVALEWGWYFQNPWRGLLGSHVLFAGLTLLGLLLAHRSEDAPVAASHATVWPPPRWLGLGTMRR
jgi:hypothetical protein